MLLMTRQIRRSPGEAFTFVEMIVIIACIAILAAFLLPAIARNKAHTARVNCVNNLKQIGLASKTWSPDQSADFPMRRETTYGGTLGLPNSELIWRTFQIISNELMTPKILVCPEDTRVPPANFNREFSNMNISYFLGLDSADETPEMFLSGDRNLTNGTPLQGGVLVITSNRPAGWTQAMHRGQGNILYADGSVQQNSSSRLGMMISRSGDTNRLAMP